MNSLNTASIRITTTDMIAGTHIVQTLGVVIGLSIRSRGVGGNIMAGLDALGNGTALNEYRELLAGIRQEALDRMGREAERRGANAVIGMHFDTAEVGHEMVEVVAYGTAVMLEDSR